MKRGRKRLQTNARWASAVIAHDENDDVPRCGVCGYDLSVAVRGHRCPECGQPIGTAQRPTLLRFADAHWLAQIANGQRLLMMAGLGYAAMILILLLLDLSRHGLEQMGWGSQKCETMWEIFEGSVRTGAMWICGLIVWAGLCMMSVREPRDAELRGEFRLPALGLSLAAGPALGLLIIGKRGLSMNAMAYEFAMVTAAIVAICHLYAFVSLTGELRSRCARKGLWRLEVTKGSSIFGVLIPVLLLVVYAGTSPRDPGMLASVVGYWGIVVLFCACSLLGVRHEWHEARGCSERVSPADDGE